MLIDRRVLSQFDYPLFGLSFLIPLLGLIVLYSAGYDPSNTISIADWLPEIPVGAFTRQLIFLAAGLAAVALGMAIPSGLLLKISYPLVAICVLLLVLVSLFGPVVNGSQRWLSLGAFNIQPSELTKLAVILALARYFARHPPRPGGYGVKDIIPICLLFVVPAALIMQQPDLGTSLVVLFIGSVMLLFVGIRPKVIVSVLLLGLISVYPAWLSLHDYQRRRIEVLVNPGLDPKGSGYHINQSKIAVGSGKLFGKGFMQGTQTQLEFLPEHTTDFVFSVLAEEWGFAGCFAVLSVYFAFLYRILQIVARSKDLFSALVVFGVGALIFMQIVVNVGMVLGLLPVVGIPLPLFSHGGSALLSTLFALGIVLGLDMRRFIFSKG